MGYKFSNVSLTLVLLLFLLSVIFLSEDATAGVFSGSVNSVSSSGSNFAIRYSQGCSSASLGPNQCYSTHPLWCPLSSIGSTGLKNNVSYCGCPLYSVFGINTARKKNG